MEGVEGYADALWQQEVSGMKRYQYVWGLVLWSLYAAPLAVAHDKTGQTAKADRLLQADHSWNGEAYQAYPRGRPQLTVLRITIAPHTALPWHTHPFPNAGYVLEGSLTIEDKATGQTRTFHKGEAFAESVNDPHRGIAGDEPTILLLTYAGTSNEPTSIPLAGEKKEY